MTAGGTSSNGGVTAEMRMRTRYGINQADQCRDFAVGEERKRIWSMLQEIDTQLIRLFLFDKGAPDPVSEWPVFASYVQAVLEVGAVPMITFAKLHRPLDDPRAVRWFANQCSDVVWGCMEQWGPEVVRDWYWCVWNEPNNAWISGDVSFEQYRRIYEAIAAEVLRWLGPHLDGRKPKIGGPAVEGFQPFWMDWVWRFVNEIDNSLIGFLDWHCYGDWRDYGEEGAPSHPATYRALMMSKTADYGVRARTIGQMLEGRGIENICGELNAHSHYEVPVRQRFNHSVFGATFYTSSLLHLLRAGIDAEMFWTGTEDEGGYGMITGLGQPRPAFHAKRLTAQHIRHGDLLSFPDPASERGDLDFVVAVDAAGRCSGLLVHLFDEPASYELARLDNRLASLPVIQKIDSGTRDGVVESACHGTVRFDGFGVAAVTELPGPAGVRA
jgi:Glycosyl hydrolases family 39